MRAVDRWKLDAGDRVRVFNAAHPAPDPGSQAVFAELEARLAEGPEAVARQRSSLLAAKAATALRAELKDRIQQLIRILVTTGEAAAAEVPDLAGKLRLPRRNGPNRLFLADANTQLALAQAHRDAFVRFGMAESVFADLAAAIERFAAVVAEGAAARQERVAASTDLREIAAKVAELVDRIDALNRYRFRDDPETLAAWNSARNVFGPVRRKGNGGAPPPEPPGDNAEDGTDVAA